MVSLAGLGMIIVSAAATAFALPTYVRSAADTELVRVRAALVARSADAPAVVETVRTSSASSGGRLFVRFVDREGRFVTELGARDVDDPLLAPPALPTPLPAGFAAEPTTVSGAADNTYRVVVVDLAARPADRDGPTVPTRALLAESLGPSRAVLRGLVRFEVIATVLVLLGVALLSRQVLRVGLRPLREMAVAANAIASGESDQRLPVSRRHCEVDELSRALDRAFDARQASEDKLRRFIADASHELRTPLTTIRGWAQLQTHGLTAEPDTVQRGARRIDQEAARMQRMVEDLLLLARLDQEGLDLRATVVDVSALAEVAVADLRAARPERSVTVHTDGRLFTEGEEDRLAEVLANVLANAVQHTPDTTPIRVSVRRAPADRIELVVADDGPGMPSASADRVFDRFYRSAETRPHGSSGAGLGLSIAHAIIARHHGDIALTSAPGRGTSVVIHLPLLR